MTARSAGLGVAGGLLVLIIGAVGVGVGARAQAEEPVFAGVPAPVSPVRSVHKCRTFALADIDKDRELTTDDRTSEVGQWVTAREAEGWRLVGVDLEIGQKSTGYPQAWQQVCLVKP